MATAHRKDYGIEINAEKLKRRMEECGLSQNELAEKAGVSFVTISNVLNNKQMPRVHIFLSIAMAIGEKMEDLLVIVN